MITTGDQMSPEEKRAYASLYMLAQSHGLTFTFVNSMADKPGYDGAGNFYVMQKHSRNPEQMISDMAHELAHYALANEEMRTYPDFGLGPSPDSGLAHASKVLFDVNCDTEEELASVFGMVLEFWAGHDPRRFTWDFHSWGIAYHANGDPKTPKEVIGKHLELLKLRGALQGELGGDDPFVGWTIPFCERKRDVECQSARHSRAGEPAVPVEATVG